MEFRTKIDQLRELMARGEWEGALRMAARFPSLGEEKRAITRAWDSHQSPALYRQMGHDPEQLWRDGITALQRRYPARAAGAKP